MSAYQAEWESEALCSELKMMPPIPRLAPMCSGESDTTVGNDAQAADEHQPERQQPDEEP